MDFALPELGEGVYEAELVRWLVKPGDVIKRGQALMEVMTDKATMEVPSPFAGTVNDLQADPGDVLKIGANVLSYAGAGEHTETPEPKSRQRAAVEKANRPVASHAEAPLAAIHNGPAVP